VDGVFVRKEQGKTRLLRCVLGSTCPVNMRTQTVFCFLGNLHSVVVKHIGPWRCRTKPLAEPEACGRFNRRGCNFISTKGSLQVYALAEDLQRPVQNDSTIEISGQIASRCEVQNENLDLVDSDPYGTARCEQVAGSATRSSRAQ
jgi:hypothetical protein